MTAGFALLTLGGIMLATAIGNMTIADIMKGGRPGDRGNLLGSDVTSEGFAGSGASGASKPVGGASTGTGKVKGVKASYATFSQAVAKGTGLSTRVVAAWCLAEGGPDDNPLNIGPGQHFGSVSGAANATVKLLHTSLYKGVIASAGKSDKSQIHAIVLSPWCPGCAGYEALLLGTYARVTVSQ